MLYLLIFKNPEELGHSAGMGISLMFFFFVLVSMGSLCCLFWFRCVLSDPTDLDTWEEMA